MSNEKFLKITYHGAAANKGTKLNAYLKMPSPTFAVLLREIAICLFEQRKQPRTELRTYWIDEDGDEIDIVDQCDYEIFMNKRSERRHLQVAPIIEAGANANVTDTGVGGTNDDPSCFVIHERVECDGCSNAPIIGFRYKCIQCPNFDLCERCEGQHKHSEHMMVRMPNDNCPSVVEAWVTGRSKRHHKRNMSSTCPFVAGTPPMNFCGTPPPPNTTGPDTTATGGDKAHRHAARKHHRRHMQNGIWTHLYNMMQDLAEGGGPVGEAASAEAAEATKSANIAAHEAATVVANAAHNAAHEAAVAAANAATAATAALNVAAETLSSEQQKSETTGAVPKNPPSTPNENGSTYEEPTLKKSNETNTTNAAPQPKPTTTPEGVPVLGSPILENVAQYVDPQYMKAGIQILNNFSEMFAKMLDPMDGSVNNGGQQCPFQASAFPEQSRKSSVSSTTSSNVSTSTNASIPVAKENEKSTEQTPLLEKDATVTQQEVTPICMLRRELPRESETSPLVDATSTAAPTPEHRRRSQSEENDWQLIENQTLPPFESATELLNCSAPLIPNPIDTPRADAATAAQQTQTVTIDYEQLSKDLRTHIAEEQQREEQTKLLATPQMPTPPTRVTAPVTVPTAAPITAPAAAAALAREEEKRTTPIYHRDPKINKAVISMMAMGFSNEGAWLTQLLESVQGSIPQALDVMSAAQRNTQ